MPCGSEKHKSIHHPFISALISRRLFNLPLACKAMFLQFHESNRL